MSEFSLNKVSPWLSALSSVASLVVGIAVYYVNARIDERIAQKLDKPLATMLQRTEFDTYRDNHKELEAHNIRRFESEIDSLKLNTRDIAKELADVNRKLDVIVERIKHLQTTTAKAVE